MCVIVSANDLMSCGCLSLQTMQATLQWEAKSGRPGSLRQDRHFGAPAHGSNVKRRGISNRQRRGGRALTHSPLTATSTLPPQLLADTIRMLQDVHEALRMLTF